MRMRMIWRPKPALEVSPALQRRGRMSPVMDANAGVLVLAAGDPAVAGRGGFCHRG